MDKQRINLTLPPEHAERLLWALQTGQLVELGVSEIATHDATAADSDRPTVFIGSSSEGLDIAEAIQVNLDKTCEVTIWSQGVFGLGDGTLEALVNCLEDFDFAILVLTADDLSTIRGRRKQTPRDNVLLELGLFIGRLGRHRTFTVYDRHSNIKIPSDLAGVSLATYQPHRNGNLRSSLGAPCTEIKTQIAKLGRR